jgi:hypothetical protein
MDELALALFYEKRLSEERVIADARGDEHGMRDAAAKMAVLQRWRPVADVEERVKGDPSPYRQMDVAEATAVDHIVRVLVAVYRDHEDYQQQWVP